MILYLLLYLCAKFEDQEDMQVHELVTNPKNILIEDHRQSLQIYYNRIGKGYRVMRINL